MHRADNAAPAGQDAFVAALGRGDERVFATLVDEYGPSILRVARTYVSTRTVAEEVVQDAWRGVISVVPDQKAITAVGFLCRAVAYYRRHGINVERVRTEQATHAQPSQ